VVLALRSECAVTLYEILEAYVNRRENSLMVSIEDFRSWLKVPEDAYRDWKDLKRNVVLPAVNEINQHGEEDGFSVSYEGVREGKAFTKIRFVVAKSAERDDRDMKLQGKARQGARGDHRPHWRCDHWRSLSADRCGSRTAAHDCAGMGPAKALAKYASSLASPGFARNLGIRRRNGRPAFCWCPVVR
jgi:hypothetical protein